MSKFFIKKIIMATNNANKLCEARKILMPLGIKVISQHEGGAECEPNENGTTFVENAIIKAKAVYEIVKMPVFADDSGLCVAALDGRPGVYSARYTFNGNECTKLLCEMKNVPDSNRKAVFKCVIAYYDGNDLFTVDGDLLGIISHEKRGINGFGYDPIFIPDSDLVHHRRKTMAELTVEEKSKISHRSVALKAFCKILLKS